MEARLKSGRAVCENMETSANVNIAARLRMKAILLYFIFRQYIYGFRYFLNQSRTLLNQNSEFCGFRIQWPSSGKIISFESTPFNCKVEYNCKLWSYGTRKSSSPQVTRVGVLKFFADLLGDQRSYSTGFSHGKPLNSQFGNHNSSVAVDILSRL